MSDPLKPVINVTRAFLPPRAEYDAWLDRIYASHHLTNNGPIHRELEEALRQRFDVPHLRLMSNGTLAIQLAIRALGVKGKVITTPFSYVATTSALLWEGCEPVFVDIDPATGCIDPALIVAAITPGTTAILATHVYGIPCDVETIEAIARKHGLKVIYDAAHAFDVTWKGRSILQWGDANTLSFHATKLFHTVEGGAVVLHNVEDDQRLRLLRSFGHIGDEHFSLGMNAKMSEPHAAMGMAVLPHMEAIKEERMGLVAAYDGALEGLVGRPLLPPGTGWNGSYYPIFLEDLAMRERLMEELAAEGVNARRYFFPALNTLPYLAERTQCPRAERLADQALCLPLYNGLAMAQVERIVGLVRRVLQPVV